MYRAYNETTSVDQMPVLYERTLPNDSSSQWDLATHRRMADTLVPAIRALTGW